MEWMTQAKAAQFYGVKLWTLRRWARDYEVRRRVIDGRVHYHSTDLEVAEYRGRHRGEFPSWANRREG